MIEEFLKTKKSKIELFHDIRFYIENKKLVFEYHRHTKNAILNQSDCIELIEFLNKILSKVND